MSHRAKDKLSKNFQRWEFACKGKNCCGGSASIHPSLITLLQHVRDLHERPIYCVHPTNPSAGSGFRCLTHNASISGASPTSDHTVGCAADIWTGGSAMELHMNCEQAIRDLGFGYCIFYTERNFIHLGVRHHEAYK